MEPSLAGLLAELLPRRTVIFLQSSVVTLHQFEGTESLSRGGLVQRSRPCSDLNGSSQSPAHSRNAPANQKQRRFSDHGEFIFDQILQFAQTRPETRVFTYLTSLVFSLCFVSQWRPLSPHLSPAPSIPTPTALKVTGRTSPPPPWELQTAGSPPLSRG